VALIARDATFERDVDGADQQAVIVPFHSAFYVPQGLCGKGWVNVNGQNITEAGFGPGAIDFDA